jgi:predicted NBD/HSP70 family sugar kinase
MARLAGSSRLLRAINECAALALLLERGPITRGDLRAMTGLSKPTTSEVLRRLTEAGLALVVGRTSGGPGPNAELYAVNPDAAFVAAVAVRTDHTVSAAVCDLTGATRAELSGRRDLDREDPVEVVAAAVDAACERAGLSRERLDHVQLSVPGSYDEGNGIIRYVDLPGWSAPGVVEGVGDRLGTAVGVDNDVNLAAIAERTSGAAAGTEAFALLWIDEGLGLAIDLDGTLLRGGRGGAGEIGYMPVGLPGQGGALTDFQDLVGGEAVVALARRYDVRARTAQRAVARVLARDTPATDEFLTALATRIAVGLAAVVAVLDPPLVVLAGDVGRTGGQRLAAAVTAALERATPLRTTVAASTVTGDAALIGALHAGLTTVRNTLLGPVATQPPGWLSAATTPTGTA